MLFSNIVLGKTIRSAVREADRSIILSICAILERLTPAEISKRKKKLKVGLTQSGKYVLYNHIDDWEIVDFGL